MFLQISHFAFTLNETKVVTWVQGPLGDQLQFLLGAWRSAVKFFGQSGMVKYYHCIFPPFTLTN